MYVNVCTLDVSTVIMCYMHTYIHVYIKQKLYHMESSEVLFHLMYRGEMYNSIASMSMNSGARVSPNPGPAIY